VTAPSAGSLIYSIFKKTFAPFLSFTLDNREKHQHESSHTDGEDQQASMMSRERERGDDLVHSGTGQTITRAGSKKLKPKM